MSKITRLEIKNIKGVKEIEIFANDNINELAGQNEAGKSSILDSILYAFGGKKAINAKVPVRNGEEVGTIICETENLILHRVIKEDGKTSLSITGKEGGKYGQTDLDKMWNDFTFDPLAFAREKPENQVKMLLELIGDKFAERLKELDNEIQTTFEERTANNRYIKNLGHRDPVEQVETVDIMNLLAEREAIRKFNEMQTQYDDKNDALNRQIKETKFQLDRLKQKLSEEEAELEQLPKAKAFKSTNKIDEQISLANDQTKLLNEYNAYVTWKDEKETVETLAEKQTQKINDLRQARKNLIANSTLPVDDVGFSEDGILVKELPFDQLSSGQKIKISTQIGMAMSPKLRLMFVRDGSLLDDNSFKAINDLAIENDYQLWIETVGKGHNNEAIIISEGMIIENDKHENNETDNSVENIEEDFFSDE